MRDEALRLHLKPFLGKLDIREITVSTLEHLSAYWMEKGRPRSKRSRQIAMGTLRVILANAVAQGLVASNAVDAWKAVQPRGRSSSGTRPVDTSMVLDAQERELLLETSQRMFPEYFPFIAFLAETGCRIGEARGLQWGDVDLKRGVATVTRQKLGGRRDEIEVSPRLTATLKEARPDIVPAETYCFPNQGETSQQRSQFRFKVWDPIVRAAFGRERRVTPHMLRHTWASLHMARGTPLKWIQTQGGWASAKMLLDCYGHYMPTEQRGYAANLAPSLMRTPDQTGPASHLRS